MCPEPAPAPGYVHGHAEPVLRSHRSRTVDNSAAYLAPYLRPGASVLDVGCGPGTITADIAARVAPGRVVAVDPAPDVVAAAARAVAEAGATNAVVLVGDVYAPQVAPGVDGPFDVVHAHQVLQHVPDPVEALRRMRALCAADGVVGARDADYAAFTWYPEVPALDEWLALYRRLSRATGGEPDAGRRLLSWARAAGFSEVTASASVWCYATPESRAWWGGLWADRIVGSAIADQALASGEATRADLERIRAGWLEWAAADDGWFVVPHGEVVCRP
ncbi:methyltransferase domain-containing protein [Kineosporia sp. R_H_3]|uniref:methyltransferase domain-containing protein n=1 Tax=Kineosporia sp. R_H_3 TaxID=1961848 RepID=UPI000B4BFE93|nr:methyltransferase domain-containing protein [Kineosporia sp. R_H_3]